jgi:hypothetical protein
MSAEGDLLLGDHAPAIVLLFIDAAGAMEGPGPAQDLLDGNGR